MAAPRLRGKRRVDYDASSKNAELDGSGDLPTVWANDILSLTGETPTMKKWLLAALFALLCAPAHSATLIGDTVGCSFTGGAFTCSPSSAVVDGNAEFTIGGDFGPVLSVDVGASSFTITALLDFPFGSDTFTLSSLDLGSPITGVLLSINGIISGLSSSNVSFGANFVTIFFPDTQWSDRSSATIELQTSPVPIPAAFPLLAAGLGAMGFMGWRRKRKTAA